MEGNRFIWVCFQSLILSFILPSFFLWFLFLSCSLSFNPVFLLFFLPSTCYFLLVLSSFFFQLFVLSFVLSFFISFFLGKTSEIESLPVNLGILWIQDECCAVRCNSYRQGKVDTATSGKFYPWTNCPHQSTTQTNLFLSGSWATQKSFFGECEQSKDPRPDVCFRLVNWAWGEFDTIGAHPQHSQVAN